MSAKQIIKDICREFEVDADELCDGSIRGAVVTAARGACIVRLKEHFSINQVAAFLHVHSSTISYHLYQARRTSVKRNAMASHARKKVAA